MSSTNPAYAHLAYKLALLEHVTNYLLENCVGTDDAHPPQVVDCPYVAQRDNVVPRDEIIHFIDQLRVSSSRVEDEMNKFDFVRRNDAGLYDADLGSVFQPGRRAGSDQEPTAEASGESSAQKAGGKRRRGGRKARRAS